MSTWPLVKFVDSPSATATVRFDCNDLQATAPRQAVEFDPGVPTLEGDPDAVGQRWGFRSPSLTVRVKGTKANALATLSALSKEQLRRTNWVLFQLSADTQPLFLRTYRTGYESLSLDRVDVDKTSGRQGRTPDAWEIRVPLVADAFAYGARITVPTVQIVQSAADLTGPTRYAMRYVLPAIKGDAPTPLRVTVTPSASSTALDNSELMIGLISGSASMDYPIADIGTGDGFQAVSGSGTGSGTTDTAYFSDSYRAVTVASSATPGGNFIPRLASSTTFFPLVPRPGRYKVLLRCSADGVTSAARSYVFALSIYSASGGTPQYAPSVTQVVNLNLKAITAVFVGWVDLGDFYFPSGSALPSDIISPTLGNGVAAGYSLKIGTADGSAGTVRIDAIRLLPVDGPDVVSARYLKAWSPAVGITGSIAATFDGDSESFYAVNTTNGNNYPNRPRLTGGFLVADPAVEQNMMVVVAMAGGDGTTVAGKISSEDAQAALDVSYHPRYLHIGDGT
jgi:hypothetical protein